MKNTEFRGDYLDTGESFELPHIPLEQMFKFKPRAIYLGFLKIKYLPRHCVCLGILLL